MLFKFAIAFFHIAIFEKNTGYVSYISYGRIHKLNGLKRKPLYGICNLHKGIFIEQDAKSISKYTCTLICTVKSNNMGIRVSQNPKINPSIQKICL